MQNLIQQGYQIKNQIAQLTEQLHAINKQIADLAEYKNGSKTGHIITPDFKVVVTQRENVKWDTEKLMSIKNFFGDRFDSLVKVEYKPDVKKIKKEGGEVARAFNWAKEVTQGTPSVTYELIAEQEEAL